MKLSGDVRRVWLIFSVQITNALTHYGVVHFCDREITSMRGDQRSVIKSL